MRWWIAVVVVALVACGGSPSPADAGAGGGGGVDSGAGGGGAGDAGALDAGPGDAGTFDAGVQDTTPPTVVNAVPAPQAMGVRVTLALLLTFSEPMRTTSLQVTAAPTIAFSAPLWNPDTTSVTLAHAAPLAFDTPYTVTVQAEDLAGNALTPFAFTFRTEAMPDTTPPTVIGTVPADQATGVSVTAPLVMTFSEPMDRASVAVVGSPAIAFGPPSWTANDSALSLAAVAPLAVGQAYVVTVQGRDVAGNAMAAPHVFGFSTTAGPDVTPPTLVASTPDAGASLVPATIRLQLVFSEPMHLASVQVSSSPAHFLGLADWSSDARTVRFPGAADWTGSAAYTVSVSGTDLAGNALAPAQLSFTTAAPLDLTPPRVLSTSPPGGATVSPTNVVISFVFSEPMDPVPTQQAFSIAPAAPAPTFVWLLQNQRLEVQFPSALMNFQTYTVQLGTGARDVAGNRLAAPWVFSFSAAPPPPPVQPAIVMVSPADTAVGVPRSAPLVVTFNHAMDVGPTQAAFSITSPAGLGGGVFSWNVAGTVMTYTPPAGWPYGADVAWQVGTGARSLSGDALPAPFAASFRVRRFGAAQLFGCAGGSGCTVVGEGTVSSAPSCAPASVSLGGTATAGDRASTAVEPAQSVSTGFLTFALGPLASRQNLVVLGATLRIQQVSCTGDPFASTFGGAIDVDHVDYGPALTASDCGTSALGGRTSALSTSLAPGWRATDATAALQDDWTNRAARGLRSQWRLRTRSVVTDGDAFFDACAFATAAATDPTLRPYLDVLYEYD